MGRNDIVNADGSLNYDQIGQFHDKIGDLSSLSTTEKGSLTGAVNEVGSQLAEKVKKGELVISILDYGAKGDGTDETTKIQAAVDAVPAGGVLLIPFATYLITGITFTKKIRVLCFGKLKLSGTGSAVTISNTDSLFDGLYVYRDYVSTGSITSSLVGTGIRFYGAKNIVLNNPVVLGFKSGIKFDGSNNKSSGYINIYSYYSTNNLIGYDVDVLGTTLSWANEVNVYGGRFGIGASWDNYVGSRYVNIPIQLSDCHRFFGVSFEGGGGQPERKIYCAGVDNEFNSCRWEGGQATGTDIEFTSTSRNNVISFGKFVEGNKIVDDGTDNTIIDVYQVNTKGRHVYGVKVLTAGSYNSDKKPIYLFDATSGSITLTIVDQPIGTIVKLKRIDASSTYSAQYKSSTLGINGSTGWQSLSVGGSAELLFTVNGWVTL